MPSHAFDVTQKSQFIKAGAGAGKTTRLIKTFLEFVKEFKQNNKRFPRVVMTTFTRKATQEVKERLLVSALKADEKEVFEYISQKSFVHISTIHGLLSLFLNQYSEKIKFPQDVKIVDTVQFERALKKQMNELLKKNSNYLELLESFSFNKLVDISIKALETKAQYRNMTFLPSSELKKIATTHKNGIIETVDQILKAETSPQKSWIGYFDYLRQIQQTVKTGTREELEQVIEDGPNKPQFKPDKPSVAPEAHDLVLLLKNELLDNLFDSDEYIEKHEKLNQLFNDFINTLYQISFDHKRRTGEMTISDLETISLQIIEEHPEAAQEFSDSWDYFMIDEYQDTSPLQVKILDQLIRDKTCFVVGDPQQSIYLFRGARSEVFETKQKQMLAKNAQVDFLETNFRSEPTLMSFINQFFTDFSTQFKPMILKSEASNSKVSSHDAYYIKTEDQALGTLLQIQALIKAGASPQDICVLSRSNKNLLDVALLANTVGVHVQLQAASGFEDKREILDLISFNKFLNNPHDDENFITLVRSPWFYIDDETLVNVAQKRQRASFWSVLAAEKPELAKYLNLFNTSGVSQATQKFLIDTEFVNFSEYYDPTGKREANIFKYLNNLILAEQKVGFSLGQFLEEQFESISLDSGSSNSEAQPVVQPNCVSLMTVHASKGLQFKHVIVLGFADIIKTSN
ncbi:MAG: UvrD-helicase domain-containing protein, partial [Pseudobdellovibrio sp.]